MVVIETIAGIAAFLGLGSAAPIIGIVILAIIGLAMIFAPFLIVGLALLAVLAIVTWILPVMFFWMPDMISFSHAFGAVFGIPILVLSSVMIIYSLTRDWQSTAWGSFLVVLFGSMLFLGTFLLTPLTFIVFIIIGFGTFVATKSNALAFAVPSSLYLAYWVLQYVSTFI